jgi:hypothetical protein
VRDTAVILALVLLSSAGACLLGMLRRRLRLGQLPGALAFTLEALGLGAIFVVVNVGVGVVAGVASRALGLGFFPLYVFGDWTLPALSLLQGLLFRRWLATR